MQSTRIVHFDCPQTKVDEFQGAYAFINKLTSCRQRAPALPDARRDAVPSSCRAQVRVSPRPGVLMKPGEVRIAGECRDFLDASRSAVVVSIPRVFAIEVSGARGGEEVTILIFFFSFSHLLALLPLSLSFFLSCDINPACSSFSNISPPVFLLQEEKEKQKTCSAREEDNPQLSRKDKSREKRQKDIKRERE